MRNLTTQPSSLPSLQSECLKLLAGVFDISRAASYMLDSRSNICCLRSHFVPPGMQRDYLDRFQGYDPLHPNNISDKSITVERCNSAVSLNNRVDNPYYTEFFNRWGVLDTVEIYLRSDERITMGFSLFLEECQGDLPSADMKKLVRLQKFMQFSLEASLESPQRHNFSAICEELHLTAKERMVVEQVLQGLPNKSIANNLLCSLPTIKTHLQNIFEKMNVNSKAEIASLFYTQNTYH